MGDAGFNDMNIKTMYHCIDLKAGTCICVELLTYLHRIVLTIP